MEAFRHEAVAALVGAATGGEPRLRRENVLAHADVLQAAFEHGPVLPLRLGTTVADADVLRTEMLAPRADVLAARLDALDGKAEMQVKAVYSEEPLLRSILAADPALAGSAKRIQELPAPSTHFERLRVGEAIAAAVSARRAADQEAWVEALRPLTVALVVSDPHHERAALNASFLVERRDLGEFDAAVEQLSDSHPDTEFKLIGPLPPYSFSDREWEASGVGGARPTWA